MTPDACVSIFQTKALQFDKSEKVAPNSSNSEKRRKIKQSIFAPKLAARILASEIQNYLKETTEDHLINILKYWHSQSPSPCWPI